MLERANKTIGIQISPSSQYKTFCSPKIIKIIFFNYNHLVRLTFCLVVSENFKIALFFLIMLKKTKTFRIFCCCSFYPKQDLKIKRFSIKIVYLYPITNIIEIYSLLNCLLLLELLPIVFCFEKQKKSSKIYFKLTLTLTQV